MKVKDVYTYWYENGNTGYIKFSITVNFECGKSYYEVFSTGLSATTNYDDTPLIDLEGLVQDELTEQSYNKFNKLVKEGWWTNAVEVHDYILIEEKLEYIKNLRSKLEDFNKVV